MAITDGFMACGYNGQQTSSHGGDLMLREMICALSSKRWAGQFFWLTTRTGRIEMGFRTNEALLKTRLLQQRLVHASTLAGGTFNVTTHVLHVLAKTTNRAAACGDERPGSRGKDEKGDSFDGCVHSSVFVMLTIEK